MKSRVKAYYKIVRWTAIPLLILIWLELMTGPAPFKGELLGRLTLGLIDPANAGKLHTVWFPPIAAGVFYLHVIAGLQTLVSRTRWLKPKRVWEIIVFVIGALLVAQFYWLFYG